MPNLRQYWAWMIALQSVFVLLAAAGPLAARAKPAASWMLAFFAALLACYLPYIVFDTWPFLRFLLPGIPLLLILGATVVVRLIERAPRCARAAALLLACSLSAIWYVTVARSLHVFDIQRAEHRYVSVGESVRGMLPDNALLLTVIQSGSIRLYGGRPTLRWDMLEPQRIDATLEGLRAAGYDPYLLLEDWEDELFRTRFAATSAVARANWPSALEYRGPISVRVLRIADRERPTDARRSPPHVVPAP